MKNVFLFVAFLALLTACKTQSFQKKNLENGFYLQTTNKENGIKIWYPRIKRFFWVENQPLFNKGHFEKVKKIENIENPKYYIFLKNLYAFKLNNLGIEKMNSEFAHSSDDVMFSGFFVFNNRIIEKIGLDERIIKGIILTNPSNSKEPNSEKNYSNSINFPIHTKTAKEKERILLFFNSK